MDHAGAFVAGLHIAAIAAMAVAIGAPVYAIWRIKTFESLLSDSKRLASETLDSEAP
jgi:hypothetical protein